MCLKELASSSSENKDSRSSIDSSGEKRFSKSCIRSSSSSTVAYRRREARYKLSKSSDSS